MSARLFWLTGSLNDMIYAPWVPLHVAFKTAFGVPQRMFVSFGPGIVDFETDTDVDRAAYQLWWPL